MIYAFEGFELDEGLFELRYEGQRVPTQPRVFGMIAHLLQHRDRVVSKDELTRELWQATVASDTAISQVVMLARKALRDEGESQRIIKTVRGRGFRFIASVQPVGSATEAPASAPREVPAATPKLASRTSKLIGRERELQVLREALAGSERNRGGLILIEGEPGIGKTTVAAALATEAAARNIDVHWGRAWEAGGAPPYWPWIQILRGMNQREGAAAMRSFCEQGAAGIVGLMPEWSQNAPNVPADPTSSHARFQLFDAMSRFLRNSCLAPSADTAAGAGQPCPRLFILDDLHAVDDASIELLRFLASELQEMGLLIVATLRDLDLAHSGALTQLVESLEDSRRLRLAGLVRNDISTLVTERLGQAPSPQTTDVLHEVSGGNPLLLGEIARQLGPHGLTDALGPTLLMSMSLPERLASAVRKQLSCLPEAARKTLTAASALGREFSGHLLAALAEVSEGELLEQLGPALQRGLLRPSASAADSLMFSHALVRAAIYTEVSGTHRVELHRRIAQTLERIHPPDRLPLFEIAHHYLLCAPSGCRAQAVEYATRAAAHACNILAFEVGAGLYDRARELSEVEGASLSELYQLAFKAGHAWYMAGRLGHAIERFDQAATIARTAGNAEDFAAAVLSGILPLRLDVWHNRSRHQRLLEALAMLPAADSAVRARLLAVSALAMRSDERLEERVATTDAAVEMARRLNDDLTLLDTLSAQHLALWGVVHPRTTLHIASEMIELGQKTGQHELHLDALLFRMTTYAELREHEALWRDHFDYVNLARHRGSPWHTSVISAFETVEAGSRGNFAAAEQLSNKTLQQGLRVNDPLAAASHAVRSLFLRLDRGVRHQAYDPASDEPPEIVPADYHPCWALLWVERGERIKAAHAMTRLLVHDWKYSVSDAVRRPLLVVAAQVCIALGDRARLERIYELLLPYRDLWLLLQAGVSLGPVAYHLGTIASALGRTAEAHEHLAEAVATHIPEGPHAARARYAYGKLLLREGDPRARDFLATAHDDALRLGMQDLLQDVESELPVQARAHS